VDSGAIKIHKLVLTYSFDFPHPDLTLWRRIKEFTWLLADFVLAIELLGSSRLKLSFREYVDILGASPGVFVNDETDTGVKQRRVVYCSLDHRDRVTDPTADVRYS
jgi:hypothetical protein